MKIGITGDTHGNVKAWKIIMDEYFKNADIILHTGDILAPGPKNSITKEYNPPELAQEINITDIPLIFAKGNCDAEVDQMLIKYPILAPYAFLYLENSKILLTHGHLLGNLNAPDSPVKLYKIDILISGHTHRHSLKQEDDLILLNPGSPTVPFDNIPTIALIENNEIKIIRIDEDETLISLKI